MIVLVAISAVTASPTTPQRIAMVLLSVAAIGAVFVRARFPYALLLVAWITTLLVTQVLLVPAILSLGIHRRDKRSFAAVALTIGLLGIVAPRGERLASIEGLNLESLSTLASWILNAIVVVIVPYSIGTAIGARRELVQSYRERAEHAEAERAARANEAVLLERARIAHEAHDVLGHKLSLLTMQAGGLEVNAAAEPEVIERQAHLIRQSARGALDDLRTIIGTLDPADPGTARSLVPQDLVGIVKLIDESRSSGATVDFSTRGLVEPDRVPEPVLRAVYRVIQEGLTNAHRHAPATPVAVRLAGSPGRMLQVEIRNTVPDPGTRDARPTRGGRGIPGLMERARQIGGQLSVEHVDSVFILRAEFPWALERDAAAKERA